MNGIIVKNISNDYTVECNNNYYTCKPRGLFRIKGNTPLVGDEVIIDPENNYILEIKKRKNVYLTVYIDQRNANNKDSEIYKLYEELKNKWEVTS